MSMNLLELNTVKGGGGTPNFFIQVFDVFTHSEKNMKIFLYVNLSVIGPSHGARKYKKANMAKNDKKGQFSTFFKISKNV